MLKRSLIIIIAMLMLLCACEKKQELGGYLAENGYWYIDFDDPTVEAEKLQVDVTLSDGTKDTSYLRRPILNVDTEGANQVTKSIKKYLDDKYKSYFKRPDDRIVKIDYETSDQNDMLVVVITEEVITPKNTSKLSTCFYYDALSDVEFNMMEYSNTNGAQLSTVYSAVLETDWAKEYEETTGHAPYEDVMTGLVYHGDLKFDVYCTNPDGITEVKLELQVEDVPLTLPDMNEYVA